MKFMARVIHHLIFERKHGLNAEHLTSAQTVSSFFGGGPFVVQIQHFRGTEAVMFWSLAT